MILKKEKGFTLIELVIVLVLLAVLGASINVLIGDTTSTKVYGTAQKIQYDIIFAQESAMTHRVHYRVQFNNAGSNSYTIKWCNYQTTVCTTYPTNWSDTLDPSTNTSPFTVTLNAGNYAGVSWTSNTFFAASNYIEFNSAGTPLDANTACGTAPCPITSAESVILNLGTRSVSVTPGTGKTTVY
ncbi:MAG TPA: prepilin-type N-terminal cleavage/methylation domain-containing protein [Nitrospiria bacterium]|nr:prepilin-type N-terminal cleavage/methylation domain-containing protein [Nitrospiria bacterium]